MSPRHFDDDFVVRVLWLVAAAFGTLILLILIWKTPIQDKSQLGTATAKACQCGCKR